jgi:hypothetical protein
MQVRTAMTSAFSRSTDSSVALEVVDGVVVDPGFGFFIPFNP